VINPLRCREAKGALKDYFRDYVYHARLRGVPRTYRELERFGYIPTDYEEEPFPGDRLFFWIALDTKDMTVEERQRMFPDLEERRIVEAAIEYNYGLSPHRFFQEILEKADWRVVGRILKKIWRKSLIEKCIGNPEIGERLIGGEIDEIIKDVEKLEKGEIEFKDTYRSILKQLAKIDHKVKDLSRRVARRE